MADDGILLSSSPDNGPMLDGTDGSGVHSLKPGSGPIHQTPPPESEATIESELVDDELIFAPVESGYDLGTLLGRGGEGEVRAAYQRAFGRIVAIKRVRRNAVDPKRLRRFRAEALITALLEHPHIVPIYDFRTGDSGELQLVMKQVVGTTWRDLLRPRNSEQRHRAAKMSRDDHFDILLKVCDAVGFAHARGFLHRDLKPENVMVGEHGEVLVMDWGCAVSTRRPAPHPAIPTLKELDSVSGTPAFMSPEQARNETDIIGPASDIYLLGGMLYQILTGRPPHRGNGIREAIAAAAKGDVISPAEVMGKAVDDEIAAIAMAALAADPSERTASAEAFASALRGYRRHAEALQMLREARRRLAASKNDTVEAEDAFRRALSSCEQALELWPEHRGARALLMKTAQTYAEHAYKHGAFRVARTMATTAAQAADHLGERTARAAADDMTKRAVRSEAETRSRDRTMRQMRTALNWGGPILTIFLFIGFLLAWRESGAAQRNLEAAQRNLERFETERAQRLERERVAIPALMAQAREQVAEGDFIGARATAEGVLAFDDASPAAHLFRGRILVVQGDREAAIEDFTSYLSAKPDDLDVQRLRELCRLGGDNPKTSRAIADLFLKQGASTEAEALFSGVDEREGVWRARLANMVPDFDQRWFRRETDGTFALEIPSGKSNDLASLESLRGIPISRIDIRNANKLRDLSPISGLPLLRLRLDGCAIRDLTPLHDIRLQVLEIANCDVSDLSPIAGIPLSELDISSNPISDLTALDGMALKRLNMWACPAITDLTPLRNARLESLSIGGRSPDLAAQVVSLRPLEGQTIRYLDLRNVRTITDFTVLERIRPDRLILSGTRIDDLSPLWSLRLQQLSISDTSVTDLTPITKHPLTRIDFPMRTERGLSDLRNNTTLERINDMAPADFWSLRDVAQKIATHNPRFTWNIRGVIEAGAVVELELAGCQVNDIRSLKGLQLRRIRGWSNQISDGSALRGMPIHELYFDGNPLTDVAWLANSPIEELHLNGTRISDLSPLKGKHLRTIRISSTEVRDIRPIMNPALEEIVITPAILTAESIKALRAAKDVLRIGIAYNQIWPAAEFWRRYDAGEFK